MAQQILIPLPPGIVAPAICAILNRITGDYYHKVLKVFEPYNVANVSEYEFLATTLGLHQVGFDLPVDFSGSQQILIQAVNGADLVNGELFFAGEMDLDSSYLEILNPKLANIYGMDSERALGNIFAGVAGTSSGAGTGTEVYNRPNGANSFQATIDENGNRTAIAYGA